MGCCVPGEMSCPAEKTWADPFPGNAGHEREVYRKKRGFGFLELILVTARKVATGQSTLSVQSFYREDLVVFETWAKWRWTALNLIGISRVAAAGSQQKNHL